MSKPSRARPCPYCGLRPGTTRDHVIAQCFFAVKPTSMVTVPACPECQNTKSRLDHMLCHALTTDWQGSEHPEAAALFPKLQRATQRRQSIVGTLVREQTIWKPYIAPDGQNLGYVPTVTLPEGAAERWLQFLVQGLSYKWGGVYVPGDYLVQVDVVHPLQLRKAIAWMNQFPCEQPRTMGDGVVSYVFRRHPDDPAKTSWLFWFYRGRMFAVSTWPPNGVSLL
jgi:hypothetical protein